MRACVARPSQSSPPVQSGARRTVARGGGGQRGGQRGGEAGGRGAGGVRVRATRARTVVREEDVEARAVERGLRADGHLRVVLRDHERRVTDAVAAAHRAAVASCRRLAPRQRHARLQLGPGAQHCLGDAVGLHLDIGGLHPLLVGRAPDAPHRGDLLRVVRERARLQPALPEPLLLALAHVPVGREEPAHARRVAVLRVARAVVDELALAQQVGAELVLVAVVGRAALEHEPRHDKLGAAHVLGAVPLLAVAHLPAALDLLRDARAVAAAPPPRHLAGLGGWPDVPIPRGLPQPHVAVLAPVEVRVRVRVRVKVSG